ncbi:GNAT family N-acetyltransferase [Croceicoccus sediminis]|uniref:GNAT family N-acetyltransferase n=1 Tax=Croceicoccus sediminis TaxID=2571150 RepID=UPI0011843309|nr:GNAT family N-acetyltransferase [Croceicoccus sediminis]
MKNEARLPTVTLELQVAAHAPELFPLLHDEAVHEFIDSKPPRSEEELRQRLSKLETRQSPDGSEQWLNWVIRRSTGQVVGYVQASVEADRTAEIGFVLGAPYWGEGLAFAATKAMLELLANGFGVTNVSASADSANLRSIKLLERLGFQLFSSDDPQDIVFRRDI